MIKDSFTWWIPRVFELTRWLGIFLRELGSHGGDPHSNYHGFSVQKPLQVHANGDCLFVLLSLPSFVFSS